MGILEDSLFVRWMIKLRSRRNYLFEIWTRSEMRINWHHLFDEKYFRLCLFSVSFLFGLQLNDLAVTVI